MCRYPLRNKPPVAASSRLCYRAISERGFTLWLGEAGTPRYHLWSQPRCARMGKMGHRNLPRCCFATARPVLLLEQMREPEKRNSKTQKMRIGYYSLFDVHRRDCMLYRSRAISVVLHSRQNGVITNRADRCCP